MADAEGRRSPKDRIPVVLTVLAALAGLLSPVALRAGTPPQPPSGAAPAGAERSDPWWLPRYDFALEVDGKPSPEACFYQERDSRRILVSAPEVSKVCIIAQDGKQVMAVDRTKVKFEKESEAARLLPGAEKGASSTTYSMDSSSVVFYVGSNRLKILPKMPLVGPAGREELLRHSPVYKKGLEGYTPEPSEIAYLRSVRTPVEVEVFFGTWCSHCKVLVPRFIKAIDAAANPALKVSYHGVPQAFGAYEPARAKGVKGVPTFIFWKAGKEVGRIPGEPTDGTIEHAVAEVLRAIPK